MIFHHRKPAAPLHLVFKVRAHWVIFNGPADPGTVVRAGSPATP
jgi:hypothetical protein